MFKKSCLTIFVSAAALIVLFVILYLYVLLPWHTRWGASTAETAMPLPGDEMIAAPKMQSTRAITIQSPPEKVWSWVVQLGQGRGGMYSYEWLENLAGCDIHNVYEIRPDLQTLMPGDKIRFGGPDGYPVLPVVEVDKPHVLVLGGAPGGSWAIYLEAINGGTATRLISRQRNDYEPTFGNFIIWRVMTEPISFIMEQKMLREFKDLAEKS
jgi:hypothetical protein